MPFLEQKNPKNGLLPFFGTVFLPRCHPNWPLGPLISALSCGPRCHGRAPSIATCATRVRSPSEAHSALRSPSRSHRPRLSGGEEVSVLTLPRRFIFRLRSVEPSPYFLYNIIFFDYSQAFERKNRKIFQKNDNRLKTIIALESCDSKATTYMIRGKMMSYVAFGCPQPIYKYILSYLFEKVKKIF